MVAKLFQGYSECVLEYSCLNLDLILEPFVADLINKKLSFHELVVKEASNYDSTSCSNKDLLESMELA